MKKPQPIRNILFCLIIFTAISPRLSAQPGNNDCSTPVVLESGTVCSNTAGTLRLSGVPATATGGIAAACGNAASPDVWYSFVALNKFPVITLSGMGTSMDNSPRLQLFGTTSCTVATLNANALACVGIDNNATLTMNTATAVGGAGLTIGKTYLIRVFTNGTTATGTSATWNFNICITDPLPADNDNCANAVTIIPGASCISGKSFLTGQTLNGATVEGTGLTSSCGTSNSQDVWYKFVTPSEFPNIKVDNLGTAWGTRLRIQLLDGTCGSFTEVGCATNAPLTPSTALTIGKTYYIRIHKNNTTAPTNGWAFNICVTGASSRMNEVFKQTTLSGSSGPGQLNDPWEITYGPDNFLWVTESKGYKVNKINPVSGVKTTVLDISQNSTFLPMADRIFNCQFANGSGAQGGLAGLALHPKFLDPVTPKNYVYISYIYSATSSTVFVNRVVRFTYNTGTNQLELPVTICDSIPGSSDHNSQRLIIAPVGGVDYLFYAAGDMGAGQFGNAMRTIKAQFTNSYEGKILRFNLEPDTDPSTPAANRLNPWIPNNNPYNATLGVQSAVWAIGIRNNQGFAYDAVTDKLYGSSHGPFSDDEINIIESARNYGHPLVIGYSWDDNVNGTTAGAAPGMSPAHPSSCPMITDESNNAATIGASYKDPLFSAYPNSVMFPSINALWNTLPSTPGNGDWPSEGWSGLGLYTSTYIPGWKQSLIATSLKWGRLVRLKLNSTGDAVQQTAGADTITYFGSINRYRDIAFAPNGKDVFVIMDKSTSTSGPSSANPVVPACGGCLQKYTFLGYVDNGGKSSIPDGIPVTQGTPNFIGNAGTSVTIDANNSNLWVPITGPDGNIMAEIFANGQNLGTITSSFYQHTGVARTKGALKYMNRSITINPSTPPTSAVKVRFYISTTEYNALVGTSGSFVDGPEDLKIFKNNDANGSAMTAATTSFFPHSTEIQSSNGYVVLQSDTISSFSTFYFAGTSSTLPVELISFTGSLQNDNTVLLKWKTENEVNTSHFVLERSIDGTRFGPIGTVPANGNGTVFNYSYTDADAVNQSSSKLYYRLKMIDLDAKYVYSDIVTITLPYISGRVAVYPNPFSTELTIAIGAQKDGKVQWKLIDNTGRTVLQHSENVRKGNNTLLINVNKISSGFYYLSIQGAGIDRKIKLQKQ